MDPVYIHDHVERSLENLPSQHRGKPRLEGVLSLFARQVQEVEDTAWAILQGRLLEQAVGEQLDQWGALLAVPRQGLIDGLYRNLLRAWLLILRSNGEPGRLAQIVALLTGRARVRYIPRAPAGASWFVYTDALIEAARSQLLKTYLERAIPAGVQIWTVTRVPSRYFGFADDPQAAGWGEAVWAEDIYHDTP